MSPSETLTLESAAQKDYIDCDAATVAMGVEAVSSGQVTRLRFKSYGRPVAGDQRGTDPTERVLYARAVRVLPFTPDHKPTILFDGLDGEEYAWGPGRRFTEEDYMANPDEYRLARNDGDTYTVVGVGVAFGVPEHGRMSPHVFG